MRAIVGAFVVGLMVWLPRAPADDGGSAADPATLARRAQGVPLWGVLRGDVDSFGVRLRRLNTIEEHVQVSVLALSLLGLVVAGTASASIQPTGELVGNGPAEAGHYLRSYGS